MRLTFTVLVFAPSLISFAFTVPLAEALVGVVSLIGADALTVLLVGVVCLLISSSSSSDGGISVGSSVSNINHHHYYYYYQYYLLCFPH